MNEDYKNRQIIPRWYPFDYACRLGEISSGLEIRPYVWTPLSYKEKQVQWQTNKDLSSALDFVGSALMANDFENVEAVEASGLILTEEAKISNLARKLASRFLRQPEPEPSFDLSIKRGHIKKIAILKKQVRAYPYNAISWADMAFHYVVLGQYDKADQCISIALNLSSENRFIIRAAARHSLHMDDPERALFILRQSDVIEHDPWLIASEISISEAFHKRSKHIKFAEQMLFASDISPKNLSELFGTIATLEVKNGALKRAKKLFRNALTDPNENTVAQAEWIAPQIGLSIELSQNVEASFEADARRCFRAEDYKRSLEFTLKWLRYQPFSARPAVHATYVAAVCLNDHLECLRIVEREAKELMHKDFSLKNNYIVSLASLDRVEEAEKLLLTIDVSKLSEKHQATYCATKGLVRFRGREYDAGRRLYGEAIQKFRDLEEERGIALATYFWIREESRIKNDVKKMIPKVIQLAKKLNIHELFQVERFLA